MTDIGFLLRQPFDPTARVDPDATALALGSDASLTYRELAERANGLALSLLDLGAGRGDRVAVLMYNSLDYWVAYFAITRIGAVIVRVNFRLSADELEYAIEDSGSSVVIADADLLDRLGDRRADLPVRTYICTGEYPEGDVLPLVSLNVARAGDVDVPLPGSDDPAMIMYTSGTTGRPKGAVWTHGSTNWFSAMQVMEWGWGPDTVIFVAGPCYHVGAIEDYALPTLTVGGQVVLLPSTNFDITTALAVAASRRVTDLTLFPSMIYQMLQWDGLAEVDLTSVRRIFTGGEALLPWAVERIREVFPGVDVVQVYGLTEGTPIAACGGPGMAFADPGSVGRAIPFCEISIRDDEGQVLGEGEAGEIWTRSPANSAGYWNKPEATAETFVDGWCRTGDLGTVVSGRLSVTGRKKDMIRSGGENIYAREIEDVLMRRDGIADAAIIGVPDARYGEAVCAVIVRRPGSEVSADDIVGHCLAHLARYKRPKHVVFVDALPRTASHKIQKYRLRESYARLGERYAPPA